MRPKYFSLLPKKSNLKQKVGHHGAMAHDKLYKLSISNYLSERQFQVGNNGALSSPRQIETGVPQGIVLGPFLFLIFFNDIVKKEKKPAESEMTLFADDLGK